MKTKAATIRQPAHLSTEAKAEWRRIVAALTKKKLIDKTARSLIVAYVRCWQLLEAASSDVEAKGMTVEHPNKQICLRPSFRGMVRLTDQLNRMLAAMKLTPASAGTQSDEDEGDLDF